MNFSNPLLQFISSPPFLKSRNLFQSFNLFFFSLSSPQPRKPLLIYNKPRQSTRRETTSSPAALTFPIPISQR